MDTFLRDQLGLDPSGPLALGVLVIGTIVVLLVLWMLFRLITRPRYASGRRGKQARLAITDATRIDDRRRLILVRRDDVEHLVMIGGPADIVVETDIRRHAPARAIAEKPATAPAEVSPKVAKVEPPKSAAPKPVPRPEPVAVKPTPPRPVQPVVKATEAKPAPAPLSASRVDAPKPASAPAASVKANAGTTARGPLPSPEPKKTMVEEMDAMLDDLSPTRKTTS